MIFKIEQKEEVQKRSRIGICLIKISMIYGFYYLVMVLYICVGWLVLAVLKKPEFIEKQLEELKKK